MSIFKLTVPGSWWVRSKSNPEWDGSGNTEGCGGFVIPKEAGEHIEKMARKYGKKPKDLEWGYMKD